MENTTNAEKLRKRARENYYKHRESRIAKVRQYYAKNKERINAQRRAEYPQNKAEIDKANKEYRERPENAAKMKQYAKDYYQRNREKKLSQAKAYRESARWLEVSKKAHAKEKQIHAHKIKARYFVANALRDGRLVRDDACGECGKKCKTQAHHHRGYERCFWLDVIWLCGVCHKAADKKQKD